MNVGHLLATGEAGGIETLIKDYADFSSHNNFYIFFWEGGVNYESMRNAGHNVFFLDYRANGFLAVLKKVKEIIYDYDIDGIITHHPAPILWIYTILLKRNFKWLKTYIYVHSNYVDLYGTNLIIVKKIIFDLAYDKCDALIAVSRSVKQSMVLRGYSAKKIKLIYNGLNCRKFEVDVQRDDSTINIIYVGRLIKQKGVHILLEALKQLDDDFCFKCHLVGDGPARFELENLVKKLEFRNEVIFYGTSNDVPNKLAQAHLFVHPAIWEEGFGIAIVEAMAAGRVPIAFRKGAIPEIIDDLENGFIVDNCDASALSDMIKNVVNMIGTDEFRAVQDKAKEKALKFDLGNFVNTLDAFLGMI